MTIIDFKDLPIWQESMILTKTIYAVSAKKEFSKSEDEAKNLDKQLF